MKNRNKLHVKSWDFNLEDGLPTFHSELTIDNFEGQERGQYIVHMIGPIKQKWRETLENHGLDIENYIPNYAYRVRMNPNIKDMIEELDFVNWIGLYHPGYKLDPEISVGKIKVSLSPEAKSETFDHINLLSPQNKIKNIGNNKIIVDIPEMTSIYDIAKIQEVVYLSNYNEIELHSEIDSQIIGGVWDPEEPNVPYRGDGSYGAYVNQIGYTGEGVKIAIADTGIGTGSKGDAGHRDFTGRVIGGTDFRGSDWGDGHGHGTHVAGLVGGDTYDGIKIKYAGTATGPYYNAQGLAYDSNLYAQRIFDNEEYSGPEDVYELPRDAFQNGAHIHSNSWGADTEGNYTEMDEIFDKAVRDADDSNSENNEMIIIFSAGNEGPNRQTISSPGNAKNVITVGASKSYMPDADNFGNLGGSTSNPDDIASFSSRGRTKDNRIKPTIVAPGHVSLSTSTPRKDYSLLHGLYSEDERYEWCSGTSMSAPLVSGAVGVAVDYYREQYGEKPSPAMVKSLLVNTARDLNDSSGNTGPIPNKEEGWGVANLPLMCDPPVSVINLDQKSILKTGEQDDYFIEFSDEDEPLKVTLAWTDKNAENGDAVTLKNDLDMEIIAPDGSTYKGNAFDKTGDSVSDTGYTFSNTSTMDIFDDTKDGFDDRNVVENIFIPPDELEEGIYRVRIKGSNIPLDATNVGENSQDYALSMYNCEAVKTKKDIFFDRKKYQPEDTVNITILDNESKGDESLEVNISSDSNPEGKLVKLYEDEIEGQFKGSVELSESLNEGGLKVSNGDKITATYSLVKITAEIDGDPPDLTDQKIHNKLATEVKLETDEPTRATIRYGKGEDLNQVRKNHQLNDFHKMVLDNLKPGEKYNYRIEIKDEAGNNNYLDNEGYLFNFTAGKVDDVEAGNVGWNSISEWVIVDDRSYSGDYSWKTSSENYGEDRDARLESPFIHVGSLDKMRISWNHNYSMERHQDGGIVEVNYGSGWKKAVPDEGYDEVIDKDSGTVLSGEKAYTGRSERWTKASLDLTPFLKSPSIQFRFRFVSGEGKNNSGWNIDNIKIEGNYKPIVEFDYHPRDPSTTTEIKFTDNSSDKDGEIVNWTWDFDGIFHSYEKNPTITLDEVDLYEIKLTVTDDYGSFNSTSTLIDVSSSMPYVDFDTTPEKITTLDKVSFTDNSTDFDGKIENWTWKIDGEIVSHNRSMEYRFEEVGVYEVELIVEDRYGVNNFTTKDINVINIPPTAEFIFEPEEPTILDEVIFEDLSTDEDGDLLNWSWNIEGESFFNKKRIIYNFEKTGKYNVTLTVTDNHGASDSYTEYISVKNIPPNANFTFSPEEGSVDENIIFEDLSTDQDGEIVNWTWDFGDGTKVYGKNPVHTYDEPGEYEVTLTITDNEGDTSTHIKRININSSILPHLFLGLPLAIGLLATFVLIWSLKNYLK
ncbi:MAG: PKD domain-containing protein [Thermoplasmatota archaeon]